MGISRSCSNGRPKPGGMLERIIDDLALPPQVSVMLGLLGKKNVGLRTVGTAATLYGHLMVLMGGPVETLAA